MTTPAKEDTFTTDLGVTATFPMHLWLNNTGNQRVLAEERAKYVAHVDRLFALSKDEAASSAITSRKLLQASGPDCAAVRRAVVQPIVAKFSRTLQTECVVNESAIRGVSDAVANELQGPE